MRVTWSILLVAVLALLASSLASAEPKPAAAISIAGLPESRGVNPTSRALFLPSLPGIAAIATGGGHTCALTTGGGSSAGAGTRMASLGWAPSPIGQPL